MLKPKMCRLRTSNLVGVWSMRYQKPWPTIKACEVGLLYGDGGTPCPPHSAATQLVNGASCGRMMLQRQCMVYILPLCCSQSIILPLRTCFPEAPRNTGNRGIPAAVECGTGVSSYSCVSAVDTTWRIIDVTCKPQNTQYYPCTLILIRPGVEKVKGQGHRVTTCILHTNSRNIAQKRMIRKCSNVVYGMTLVRFWVET